MCKPSYAVLFMVAILTIACGHSASGKALESSSKADDSESVALGIHFSVRKCIGDICDSQGTSLDDTVHIKLENRGRGYSVDHFGKWGKTFARDSLEFHATVTVEKIAREDVGEFYVITTMIENSVGGAHSGYTIVPDIDSLYKHEIWCTNVKVDEATYVSNLSLGGKLDF